MYFILTSKSKPHFVVELRVKKSMNKSTMSMCFKDNTAKLYFLTFFLHVSCSMVISRTKIHIFDMEVHKAHQPGAFLWLKQVSFFCRETYRFNSFWMKLFWWSSRCCHTYSSCHMCFQFHYIVIQKVIFLFDSLITYSLFKIN